LRGEFSKVGRVVVVGDEEVLKSIHGNSELALCAKERYEEATHGWNSLGL